MPLFGRRSVVRDMPVIVGTAGWSIPLRNAASFPDQGAALERYAARFPGAEINSSFHRSHRRSTWERWAESVPDGFRFSVKVPKGITHKNKLIDCVELLEAYLEEVQPLGPKLAVHLVQLPPSLAFDAPTSGAFFAALTGSTDALVACEPRHPSWFEPEADAFLEERQIARVAADPARVPQAAIPGGWRGLAYYRLHGSPVMYRSSYGEERLDHYAAALRDEPDAWCIFDNTASSAATGNALALMDRLGSDGGQAAAPV